MIRNYLVRDWLQSNDNVLDGDSDGEYVITDAAARCAVQLLECYFIEKRFSRTLTTAHWK